jgi:hypothetical protein
MSTIDAPDHVSFSNILKRVRIYVHFLGSYEITKDEHKSKGRRRLTSAHQ